MTAIDHLEPTLVWKHFATFCATPRMSKHEAALRGILAEWAQRRGLAAEVDAAGNLLLRKPASPGREGRPGVVLQAHLDMVCQANQGVSHDFTRDPIEPVVRDGWLVAERTTLGADNGVGASMALAVLEDASLVHPPIEVLLTVDEETGLGGANGLAPGLLQGRRLLNLDTEEWGEFYLGCAGGQEVTATRHCRREPLPPGFAGWRIAVSGLVGGHSGIDIHRGRGNANKLLVRLLRALASTTDLRLSAFEGGTARNALPREAWAEIAAPAADQAKIEQALGEHQALFRAELAGAEGGLALSLTPAAPADAISRADQTAMLAALNAAPAGVRRMSAQFQGVVETSNNLGVVTLSGTTFSANLMIRSLRDSAAAALADEIGDLFGLAGCDIVAEGGYAGWTPDPGSSLLALCREVYRREFGAEVRQQVIHAGLECGVIGSKYPDMDMVSLGPTIQGAHAPGERVHIASVGECWRLLKAILAEL